MRQVHGVTAGVRRTYDATVRTTGCEITSPSVHAELDEATGRLLIERARFIPGRDAEGGQIGGTYSNRIRWQIPEGRAVSPMPTPFMPENVMENWPRGAFPRTEMALIDPADHYPAARSEEHTYELQSLMRIQYDVFCMEKTNTHLA